MLSDIAAHLTNAKNVGKNCHDSKLFMQRAAAFSCTTPGTSPLQMFAGPHLSPLIY